MHRKVKGTYLKRWMTLKRLSYEEVAQALDVHMITVRNWEKRRTLPTVVKIAFDAIFLTKSPEDYIGRIGRARRLQRIYPVFTGPERRKNGNTEESQEAGPRPY